MTAHKEVPDSLSRNTSIDLKQEEDQIEYYISPDVDLYSDEQFRSGLSIGDRHS